MACGCSYDPSLRTKNGASVSALFLFDENNSFGHEFYGGDLDVRIDTAQRWTGDMLAVF